jgi:carbamate kinase
MIALGGNALSPPDSPGSFADQMATVRKTAARIADVMAAGYKVVLTHGNGPQVGALLLQQETGTPPAQPLEVCGAMSQGQIGYMLSQALTRELHQRGADVPVAAVLTQTLVDPDDPAFEEPTKPIGPHVDADRAGEMRAAGMAVRKVRDTGDRDYRRVVASPEPRGVVEDVPIRHLVDRGDLVVCGGGGGVPVTDGEELTGHDAVVDKDRLAQVLAHRLHADALLVLTDVDGVYRDFGTPEQRRIERITTTELRDLHDAGTFPPGSMGPKVEAVCKFVDAPSRRSRRAYVAAIDDALAALESGAGTVVTAEG